MRIMTAALLLVGTQAWALPMTLPETDEGLFLVNALQRVVSFVKSPAGQVLFSSDFSAEAFAAKADQVTFEFTSENLIDHGGEKRCLMNYGGSPVVRVRESEECLTSLRSDSSALHITLLHEVLNMVEIEKPKSVVGSIYEVSRKLLSVDVSRVEVGQEFVLHPTCEIWQDSEVEFGYYSARPSHRAFIQAKGYSFGGILNYDKKVEIFRGELKRPLMVLNLKIVSYGDEYQKKARVTGAMRIQISSPGNRRAFFGANVPARIRMNHGGEQFAPELINAGKALSEALPGIPDCVKLPVVKR